MTLLGGGGHNFALLPGARNQLIGHWPGGGTAQFKWTSPFGTVRVLTVLVPTDPRASLSSAALDTGYQTEDAAVQWSVQTSTIIASHEAWQNGRYAQKTSLTVTQLSFTSARNVNSIRFTHNSGNKYSSGSVVTLIRGRDVRIFRFVVCLTTMLMSQCGGELKGDWWMTNKERICEETVLVWLTKCPVTRGLMEEEHEITLPAARPGFKPRTYWIPHYRPKQEVWFFAQHPYWLRTPLRPARGKAAGRKRPFFMKAVLSLRMRGALPPFWVFTASLLFNPLTAIGYF